MRACAGISSLAATSGIDVVIVYAHFIVAVCAGTVWSLALDIDQRTLVSGASDGVVCVWDVFTMT